MLTTSVLSVHMVYKTDEKDFSCKMKQAPSKSNKLEFFRD